MYAPFCGEVDYEIRLLVMSTHTGRNRNNQGYHLTTDGIRKIKQSKFNYGCTKTRYKRVARVRIAITGSTFGTQTFMTDRAFQLGTYRFNTQKYVPLVFRITVRYHLCTVALESVDRVKPFHVLS